MIRSNYYIINQKIIHSLLRRFILILRKQIWQMSPIFILPIIPILPVKFVILLLSLFIIKLFKIVSLPLLFSLLSRITSFSLLDLQAILMKSCIFQISHLKCSLILSKSTISWCDRFHQFGCQIVKLESKLSEMILLFPFINSWISRPDLTNLSG